ncbi:MAG TPA: histidine phosphatase family protein [Amnibacterium sp.]|jgi:probable phosphoglycerate mutase|uniref:histidine phosphatase family protein n=1 Tax=Amnibacterium sp. TaxID=1872496 RepID=UPI002F920838
MTDLVLVRHGETEWNRLGRVQGLSDIPLNETGRRQAREAGRRLARQHWDGIASSPLSRAAETARIIASEVALGEPELVEALVERNYGEAEGMTGEEIDRRWAGVLKAREPREAVIERVRPALLALAEKHPGSRLLVVSHGGVIGSLVRDVTRWTWPERGVRIENGSDHVFRVEDGRISLITFAGRPWSSDLLPVVDPVSTAD